MPSWSLALTASSGKLYQTTNTTAYSQSSSRMTMCCSNTDPDISNSQCGATGFICYNDDSTGDAQGRTCSQYFDFNACTNGIRGFQTDSFNPNDQCCSCSLTAGTKVTMWSSRMTCSQRGVDWGQSARLAQDVPWGQWPSKMFVWFHVTGGQIREANFYSPWSLRF